MPKTRFVRSSTKIEPYDPLWSGTLCSSRPALASSMAIVPSSHLAKTCPVRARGNGEGLGARGKVTQHGPAARVEHGDAAPAAHEDVFSPFVYGEAHVVSAIPYCMKDGAGPRVDHSDR